MLVNTDPPSVWLMHWYILVYSISSQYSNHYSSGAMLEVIQLYYVHDAVSREPYVIPSTLHVQLRCTS